MFDFILERLPKADCHKHLKGAADDRDVLRAARWHGVDLSAPPGKRAHHKHINSDGSRIWSAGDFSSFHQAYADTADLFRTPEDGAQIAHASLVRQSQQNCIYTRLLCGVLNGREKENAIDFFAGAVLPVISAIERARFETGIEAFISISITRHLPDAVTVAHRSVEAYEAFRKKHPDKASFITGFGLAGDERRSDYAHFHDAFAHANAAGLQCSTHTGEVTPAEDIRGALTLPGIASLAHILSAADDPQIFEQIRARGIAVEQLLISNLFLHGYSGDDLPCARFIKEDLRLKFGSDSPGMQRSSIGDEYKLAAKCFNLSISRLLNITANSIYYDRMPEKPQRKLIAKVRRFSSKYSIPLRPEFLVDGARKSVGRPRY
jgi:adenosine deaminase